MTLVLAEAVKNIKSAAVWINNKFSVFDGKKDMTA